MQKKDLYEKVIAYFQQEIPVAETELQYMSPYQLLIAVILSAQCTDKRVNMITPPLFEAFPTPEVLAESSPEEVYEYIRSVSYPNNKAKHLVGMARMLVKDFGSQVPDNMEDLLKLPGVGRKTANVIQSVVFNKAAMAVDTHVFRVSHRIGLVSDSCTTPLATELELVKYIPEEIIPTAHHWLILHGRYTCVARTPRCEMCGLKEWCAYFRENPVVLSKTTPAKKTTSTKITAPTKKATSSKNTAPTKKITSSKNTVPDKKERSAKKKTPVKKATPVTTGATSAKKGSATIKGSAVIKGSGVIKDLATTRDLLATKSSSAKKTSSEEKKS